MSTPITDTLQQCCDELEDLGRHSTPNVLRIRDVNRRLSSQLWAVGKLEANADIAALEACNAVLLFHSGSPWDDAKQAEWQRLGALLLGEPKFHDYHYARGSMTPTSFEATTRVLCDMVRAVIAKAKQ